MPTQEFQITTTNDDQQVENRGSSYSSNMGGFDRFTAPNPITVGQVFAGNTYAVRVGLLRWDTSSIPDNAVIESAVLEVNVPRAQSPNGRDLQAEWYSWSGSSSNDYSFSSTNNAFAGSGYSVNSISTGRRQFTLVNLQNVNVSGYTSLRFHLSGPAPSGVNVVDFSDYSQSSSGAAKLIVTYTVPVQEYLGMIPI